MAKNKKKRPIHHHIKRAIVVTPKFVHGVFVGALAGALLVLVLRSISPAAAATAPLIRDCSSNSIIQCGALTPAEFIKKVKTDKPGDLQTIFKAFGLPSSQYNDFLTSAKIGSDLRNGDVVVNGNVVATKTFSFGRQKLPGETPIKIGGKTYYGGMNNTTFAKGVNSIPVMVFFNSKGIIQFAVMEPCGNPVGGKPVIPKKPPTPSPSPTPSPTPTPTPSPVTTVSSVQSLPNTGAGAVLVIGVLAAIGGYVFHMAHRHIGKKRHSATHHKRVRAHKTH
jgi:hypothetical protein